jgi:hypothetical protein
LFTVGKYIFDAIAWITDPDGKVAGFIRTVVKTVFTIRKWIKEMVKKSGKSGVDTLCMFIAGDYLGLALNACAGLAVKAWEWLRETKFFKWIIGMVKMFLAIGKLVASWATVALRSIAGSVKQILIGNFGGVVDALTGPWKDLWQ